MAKHFRTRVNDHLGGAPVPEALRDGCVWSSAELAQALQDFTVLEIPLPGLTQAEHEAGLVAGWKRTTTCDTKTVGELSYLSSTKEEWVLGKWIPAD
jgi:hypothetical protein